MYDKFEAINNRKWVSKKVICQVPQGNILKTLLISPDMSKVAYILEKRLGLFKRKFCIVIDGKEGKQYDAIGQITFSPDSKHTAYRAINGKRQLLILDDEEVIEYSGIGSPIFSPDGKHLAYCAEDGDKWFVIIDGKEGKRYSGGDYRIVFSPDSKHFAYGAVLDDKKIIVFDGMESGVYDGIDAGSLTFSPDGQRFAFAVREKNKWLWIIDGQKCKMHDELSHLAFSPDSAHYAYMAADEQLGYGYRGFITVDGEEGYHYDRVGAMKPVFSPDSKHVAYVAIIKPYSENRIDGAYAGTSSSAFLVVDKKEGILWSGIDNIIFAPDNIHVFHSIGGGHYWYLKCFDPEYPDSNVESTSYAYISPLNFSPDGKRILFVAKDESGRMSVIVVDGTKSNPKYSHEYDAKYAFNQINGEAYDDIVPIQGKYYIHFSEQNKFEYIAYSKKDKALYLISDILK